MGRASTVSAVSARHAILLRMELPLVWSLVLLLAGIWNIAIWPRFWQRIDKDPRSRDADGRPTRFRTVHAVLIVVSLAFGVAITLLGVLTLV